MLRGLGRGPCRTVTRSTRTGKTGTGTEGRRDRFATRTGRTGTGSTRTGKTGTGKPMRQNFRVTPTPSVKTTGMTGTPRSESGGTQVCQRAIKRY